MAIKILNDLLPIAEQTEVGVVKPDNVSITITETGELQSSVVDLPDDVVTAENYDNPKLWKGTLEEYNAIETKDPLVTYIITDDNVETLKTTDYNALSNKPSINDVTLEGNKTLEELNIQSADTSLTTSQITNCITKIPQDIKLELTDGTLTLKAGSKVYVPNGPGIFDIITVQSDINTGIAFSGSYNDVYIVLQSNGTFGLIGRYSTQASSGETDSISNIVHIWYDTTNNKIKRIEADSSYNDVCYSFPLGVFSNSANKFTSIDQVFNGFGYIGSTIFALPGVEYLVANDKNIDGSLNNDKVVLSDVRINTVKNSITKYFTLNYAGSIVGTKADAIESTIKPSNTNTILWYNPNTNIISEILPDGTVLTPYREWAYGTFTADSTGRITSFNPKTSFHAIDRNDTEWASTASKPSSRYIDLTLGASGSTYTAPANGWFAINKANTAAGQSVTLYNESSHFRTLCANPAVGSGLSTFIPVKKGDIIAVFYDAGGDLQWFRFIYDEGVK